MIGNSLKHGFPLCSICFSQRTMTHSTTSYRKLILSRGVRNFTYSASQQSARSAPEPEGLGAGKSVRLNVDLDSTVDKFLKENDLKPKNHPGVFQLKKQTLPEKFLLAAERILAHENLPSLMERSQSLQNYLWSRHLPMENYEYKEKVTHVEERISAKDDALKPFLAEEQQMKLEQARDRKIKNRLKRLVYHWEPMDYNQAAAMEYLFARSSAEYATLMRIFKEIETRDPEFKPKTLCDFGSGIGTVVWASRSIWQKTLGEYLCADVSRDMNDLADLLLRGGNLNNDHGIPDAPTELVISTGERQQIRLVSYDMVVSAFSLMELPNIKARLEMLNILWKKTSNYLVIVEQGTNAGFQAIIEARDFILQLDKSEKNVDCHIFSPCPNDTVCPRYTQDNIPCNFSTKYRPLYPFNQDITKSQVFSYVVIKKGPRNSEEEQWPRLIKTPMIRRKHVICRVCTKEGNLSEVLLTKRQHSQTLYRIARKSNCGDLLPIQQIDISASAKPDLWRSQNAETNSGDS